MRQKQRVFSLFLLSPSSRRAWIEIFQIREKQNENKSPSSRRAWIEIPHSATGYRTVCVALLAEGVDRNAPAKLILFATTSSPSSRRAWIEIVHHIAHGIGAGESPSSRRAWIEIQMKNNNQQKSPVALLAEGVDRNAKRTGLLVP